MNETKKSRQERFSDWCVTESACAVIAMLVMASFVILAAQVIVSAWEISK